MSFALFFWIMWSVAFQWLTMLVSITLRNVIDICFAIFFFWQNAAIVLYAENFQVGYFILAIACAIWIVADTICIIISVELEGK